jgi:hypothetical protein
LPNIDLYWKNQHCSILRNKAFLRYSNSIFSSWSLTLREEHRLRVFENRVVRGIFGPKRDEVTGEWRKLDIGEFHIF